MQIICEYCGRSIDTSKEDCCEYCGASYKDNAHYIKMQKMAFEKKQRNHQASMRKQENEIEMHENKKKVRKILKWIVIFYFVSTVLFPFAIGLIIGIAEAFHEDPSEKTEETVMINYDNNVIGLNTWAQTDDLIVQVTSVKEREYNSSNNHNKRLISVYFSVKNTSNKSVSAYTNQVRLTANSIVQQRMSSYLTDESHSINVNDLNVKPGKILSGYYIFEVDKDAKQFIFTYDNASIQFSSLNIEYLSYD